MGHISGWVLFKKGQDSFEFIKCDSTLMDVLGGAFDGGESKSKAAAEVIDPFAGLVLSECKAPRSRARWVSFGRLLLSYTVNIPL